MKKDIIILGSTGSIGDSSLLSINKSKNIKIKLLTTNKNITKIFKQAKKYNVKNVIVEDLDKFNKYKKIFLEEKINLYHGIENINKILKKKVTYCINAISGINGLYPTIKVIPFTQNILIANKESIICGWKLISKELKKYKTKFIPIDSEHFSIWKLIEFEDHNKIEKIVLTASGGPFLNKPKYKISNIKPKFALKHPNWKMGKKISIDSSNMMNKIFEFIEAKKIFNLKKKKLSILIEPSSYVHAIIYLNGGLIKFLAHESSMIIPISNALEIIDKKKIIFKSNHIDKINNLNFIIPNFKKFPLLNLISLIPEKDSYFETILIALNDNLVEKYLNGKINYVSISKNLMYFIKCSYFTKFYKFKPKNINDIKDMINITNKYLDKNIKYYVD